MLGNIVEENSQVKEKYKLHRAEWIFPLIWETVTREQEGDDENERRHLVSFLLVFYVYKHGNSNIPVH